MSESGERNHSVNLVEENKRLKAQIEQLIVQLQGQRRLSEADAGKLESEWVINRELQRENALLKAELHSLDPGGGESADGLFLYRTSPNSFARALVVPPEVHQAVERESSKWDNGPSRNTASWIDRLRGSEIPLAYERCLHDLFLTRTPTCWTRVDRRRFACRVCTNTRRPCCVWDVSRKKVIVLPLALELRRPGRQGEPTDREFWIASSGFVGNKRRELWEAAK